MNIEMNTGPVKLPEEIIIPEEQFLLDSEGKRYLKEIDGVKYGGDFLPMPPQEIDLNIPPPPTENNAVI